ncbi:hypothetical protein NHX12_026048 [Muraenolepis orangiensis]|uniref:Uncharacterized protein n=1 Tax=Muraenolepis orangiensis TaxID=630683 RepID=A0A9Q0ELG6_9TELE|nr:hypothetical protein NHX12_026048 [Muraenolepis orangiensis]
MKRFMAIVLRGLVHISKEHPIWAKEQKKHKQRRRRTVRPAKSTGRGGNFSRAVRIPGTLLRCSMCG